LDDFSLSAFRSRAKNEGADVARARRVLGCIEDRPFDRKTDLLLERKWSTTMNPRKLFSCVAVFGLVWSAWAQEATKPDPVKEQPQKQPEKEVPPAKEVPQKPLQPGQPGQITPLAPGAKPGVMEPEVPSTGGRVEFAETTHDFGVISDDKPVEFEFPFVNKGTGPLTIVRAQGSCGCTVPALTKTVYEPGESGAIKVQFNGAGKRGPQHTTVTVTTNDDQQRTVILNVKAEVRPLVMAEPQWLQLGEVRKGQGKTMVATITSRVKEIAVVGATATIAPLTAKVLPMVEAQVNNETVWQYPIEVTLLPTAPVGKIAGMVSVRTSEPGRTVQFNVQGDVIGDVQANPARVQLQALTPGQVIAATVTLASRTGKAFKVLEIQEQPLNTQMGPAFASIDIKEIPGKDGGPVSYLVTLGGTAPSRGGALSGNLIVKTDLPDEGEIKVPYYGFVRQTPKPVPVQVTPEGGQPAQPSPNNPQDPNPLSRTPTPAPSPAPPANPK
jgi:hypothetical protein